MGVVIINSATARTSVRWPQSMLRRVVIPEPSLCCEVAVLAPNQIGDLIPAIRAAVARAVTTNPLKHATNGQHFSEDLLGDDRVENMYIEPRLPIRDLRKSSHHPCT